MAAGWRGLERAHPVREGVCSASAQPTLPGVWQAGGRLRGSAGAPVGSLQGRALVQEGGQERGVVQLHRMLCRPGAGPASTWG